ncbi:MAG: integrase arm-type DNA-binding domain-containing protein [Novosphingobium sp.]
MRPNGSKLWRLKYRFAGKEKLLALGAYPEVSLTSARNKRAAARALLDQGIDPAIEKRQRTATLVAEALDSFKQTALAWHKIKEKTLSPRYGKQVMDRLENHVFPKIGSLPLKAITPPMALEVIRAIEAKGHHDMAHRVVNHMSDVFVWAIASGIAEQDPAGTIRKALAPTDTRLRPAMMKLELARSVLVKTEAMPDAHWSTLLASRLLALTAARPGVVQLAERSEFEDLDGELPIWRIPAAKMKLTRRQKRDAAWEFVIPLSLEAVAVVKAALSVTASAKWLFTGIGGKDKPISDSTISGLYRDAGFRGIHVPHGWRATFSTIMNERAAAEDRERNRAIIDMMLAHTQEGVEPIYNRAMYMPRRRELAQTWADLLMAELPAPTALLPDRRPWRSREGRRDGRDPTKRRSVRPGRR